MSSTPTSPTTAHSAPDRMPVPLTFPRPIEPQRTRLAIGSAPRDLLTYILGEGAGIACVGIVVGVGGGFLLARIAGSYVSDLALPGALPLIAAATILVIAAILASLVPAARAARVDVIQALRSE